MPAEDHKSQKKIQAWIPLEMWDKIVSLGYNSPTIAVTKAFEKLLEDSLEDPYGIPNVSPKGPLESLDIPTYKARIEEAQRQIKNLEERLKGAPDREELIKLQVTNEGLKSLLEEREKRIEEINSHYENIKSFANYFKSSEPKQIEVPAAEKKKPWYKIW
jgi:hypothetical protein